MEIKREKQRGIIHIDLLEKANVFNLSPDKNIYDEQDWLFMFLLPKTSEDIEVMNQLFKVCRNSIIPQAFSDDNIGELIAMEYAVSDGKLDWTCFYNVREIVKYNTRGKFDVVPVD